VRKKPFSIFTFIFVPLSFITLTLGCDALSAEEVARFSFDRVSTEEDLNIQTQNIDLEAGEKVHLWTEMNMEYEGQLGLEYQILLIKGSDTLTFIRLDPEEKDITTGEFKTTIGGSTKWRFSGRMNHLTVEDAGTYTFSTLLVSSDNPSLKLNKADLVLKK
jgi:hypothetical protein